MKGFSGYSSFSRTSKCSVCRNPPEVSSCLQLLPDFGYYKPYPSLCYPDTVRTQKGGSKGDLEGRHDYIPRIHLNSKTT